MLHTPTACGPTARGCDMSDRRWDPAAVSKTSVLSSRSGDARSGVPLNASGMEEFVGWWWRLCSSAIHSQPGAPKTHSPYACSRGQRQPRGGSWRFTQRISVAGVIELASQHLAPTLAVSIRHYLLPVLLSLIDRHWQGDTFTKVCGIILDQNTTGFACFFFVYALRKWDDRTNFWLYMLIFSCMLCRSSMTGPRQCGALLGSWVAR